MDIFDWIARELRPTVSSTTALIYDAMASQSGEALPVIYQPFDAAQIGHWCDRGAALDFALSTRCEGQRVLDFGPGDGWPSLIIAPFAGEVVGVDGSQRRVDVCTENAARLHINNATFHFVASGTPLPFDDGSFDAVVAASSVEQTPDPRATLAELYRVLRPGGRLRLSYEALGRYRGGAEREVWPWPIDNGTTRLILYDRVIGEETVNHVGLTYALPRDKVAEAFGVGDGDLSFAAVTVVGLERLRPALVRAECCTTRHPSCATWVRWLVELGFSQVHPTHAGSIAAAVAYRGQWNADRPTTLAQVDAYLRPIVAVAVELLAPADLDPMITAMK